MPACARKVAWHNDDKQSVELPAPINYPHIFFVTVFLVFLAKHLPMKKYVLFILLFSMIQDS